MKITVDKFNEYLVQYVQGVLIPEARRPMTKFMLGALLGSGGVRLPEKVVEAMKMVGVVDEDGNIEVETLKNAIEGGFKTAGEVPLAALGIHLDRPEIDKFHRLLETGAIG